MPSPTDFGSKLTWIPKRKNYGFQSRCGLVGREFKNSLFIDSVDFSKQTRTYYGWEMSGNLVPTGINDAFREFWFFGAVLFFFFGRAYRFLWERVIAGNLGAKIIYIPCSLVGMLSVISGLTGTISFLSRTMVFLSIILWVAKMPSVRSHHNVFYASSLLTPSPKS